MQLSQQEKALKRKEHLETDLTGNFYSIKLMAAVWNYSCVWNTENPTAEFLTCGHRSRSIALLPYVSIVWGIATYFHVCILHPISKSITLIFPSLLKIILEASTNILLHQHRSHFSQQYTKRFPSLHLFVTYNGLMSSYRKGSASLHFFPGWFFFFLIERLN